MILRHCQEGGDLCRAGQRDGVVCPEESCDIDDGVRPPDPPKRPDPPMQSEPRKCIHGCTAALATCGCFAGKVHPWRR